MVEELNQHEIDSCCGGKSLIEQVAEAAARAAARALSDLLDSLAGPNA